MDKGRVATQGPMRRLKQPRGQVFELRVKASAGTVTVRAFVERLRAAGLECHATDDDVMRVFVPGEAGARELFALAAAAARPGPSPCGRACRRSRMCSRRRWGRNESD